MNLIVCCCVNVCELGIPVSLLLNATDLELPGRISRVEFIDLHGDVLTEIPTQFHDTRPALYNVSNIVTPAEFFYIKVSMLISTMNKGPLHFTSEL